jgi:hypothetical protein
MMLQHALWAQGITLSFQAVSEPKRPLQLFCAVGVIGSSLYMHIIHVVSQLLVLHPAQLPRPGLCQAGHLTLFCAGLQQGRMLPTQ